MNETILAQFYVEKHEYKNILEILQAEYGFELVEAHDDMPSMSEWYTLFHGRLDSQSATFIALKHPHISGRMNVSYIPDTAKDKYRK